jgi:site-specific recombinase XerD
MATLIEQFELDQKRRGLSPNTLLLRNRQLALFENWFGKRIEKASPENFETFLDSRIKSNGDPISAKTRSCYLTTFSAFFKWGIKHDKITVNPIEKIDRPQVHNGMPNPIPEPDLARAMKAAKPLMRCWLALEAYGGLRCMEVAVLEAKDIDYDIEMIRIRHGKGDKSRNVTLHPEIVKALRAYAKEPLHNKATAFRAEGDGRLWPRCNPASVSQRINRYLHGMDITHTAHKNRHRYGTQLHKSSGGDLLVVQRALGHSDPKTAAIYAGIEDEEVKTAAMAIPVAGQKIAAKYADIDQ